MEKNGKVYIINETYQCRNEWHIIRENPTFHLHPPFPLACKYKKGLCMSKCAIAKCKWMKVMVFGIDKQLVKIQEMDCLNDGGPNGRKEYG
jgi:hypothetical protein